MEFAQPQDLCRRLQLAGDVIEAEQLGSQIVTLEGHLTVCLQLRQPLRGSHGAALVQLIQLEQQAGIVRLEGKGPAQT
ncbi:hypothetical protein D3C75_911060 [compost metagenome]